MGASAALKDMPIRNNRLNAIAQPATCRLFPRGNVLTRCVPLFLGVACFLLLPTNYALAQSSKTDSRSHGAHLFETSGCQQCHSILGVGGDRAPDLGAVALRRDPQRIREQIVKGGHGMPPFGQTLKKDEIDELVDFLSSCRSKTAPGCRRWMPPPQQPQSQDQSDNQ